MSKLKKWGFSRFITRPDQRFCLKIKLILITRFKQESIFRSPKSWLLAAQDVFHPNLCRQTPALTFYGVFSPENLPDLLALTQQWASCFGRILSGIYSSIPRPSWPIEIPTGFLWCQVNMTDFYWKSCLAIKRLAGYHMQETRTLAPHWEQFRKSTVLDLNIK